MDLSIIEQLCSSTVRIETTSYEGISYSGTGFFFNLSVDEKVVLLLVTNKHVVEGMSQGRFIMSECDENDKPIYTEHVPINIQEDFEKNWIFHPDPEIDLCVMPMGPIIQCFQEWLGKRFFYRAFDNTIIPTVQQLQEIDIAEDVLMIGYPNGLWDAKNNMPIVRRGITATDVKLNYNGKREFVIDAACFPGSSGSPIVLFNKGGYADKNGNLYWGKGRLVLLGILYAGPQLTVSGDIKVVTIPDVQEKALSIFHIPNNLGYIIKSETLLDFIPIVKSIYKL